MTNKEVFSTGNIIEQYNYIHPIDFEGVYLGYLVELKNIVYEVVSESDGTILSPNEEARIVSNGLDEIYEYCDYLHDKPLNICEPIIDEEKLKNKVYPYDEVDIFDDGYITFNGTRIDILDASDIEEDFDFFEDDE